VTTRKRRLLIALATIVAVVGAGLATAAIYVSGIHAPGLYDLPQSTTVYYSDGRTVMTRLGAVDRTVLPYARISESVVTSAVAATDPEYWSSSRGPIERAVVRTYGSLEGSGASTRLRVAVAAWKLDDEYSKEEILAGYLNAVPFGRDAFGVEAAARRYFNKSAAKDAPSRLTPSEAVALAALLDQRTASEPSRERWNQIADALVAAGKAKPGELAFPATVRPEAQPSTSRVGGPSGLVVQHALAEIVAAPGFQGRSWDDIRQGGYQIVTTVDARAQELLEGAADGTRTGSVMYRQPKQLQAAAVIMEPGTGRVLAYFRGHNALGADYAGVFTDEQGDVVGFGAHRPGTSFFVYTLAAALRSGISLDSMWDSKSGKTFPGRKDPVRNSSTCVAPFGKRDGPCSLLGSTVNSLNVPYYAVAVNVGADKVVATASAAGIRNMWTDDRKRVDLADAAAGRFTPDVALGQNPVTVLDQANAMATFAAGGVPANAHFVKVVTLAGKPVYGERLAEPGAPVLSPEALADLSWALSQSSSVRLTGMDAAGKAGTWIDGAVPTHAWMVGYTSSLAAAVWVGSAGAEKALTDSRGAMVYGAGLPTAIYRKVMTAAHAALKLKPKRFAPPAHVGGGGGGG
jgi:membrane peptidoglycan carboxypeptidase